MTGRSNRRKSRSTPQCSAYWTRVGLWSGILTTGLTIAAGNSVAQESGSPKGVNPKDVVTKIDIIARRDRFNRGLTLDSLTAKYDVGLNAQWALAIEAPLARYSAPGLRKSGISESKLKLRRVETTDWGALMVGGEAVLPTNNRDVLGSGKWQFNPSAGAVFSVSSSVFVFTGYQHFWSVAGGDAFPRINQSQPRLLVAKTSPQGWWVMGDFKYTLDHETNSRTFDAEFETGTMVSRDWALSFRLIKSGLDSQRRWGGVAVVRHLF